MLDRTSLLALAIGGMFIASPTARCLAQASGNATVQLVSMDDDHDKADKDHHDDEKDDEKGGEHEHEWKHEEKEIEQAVPLAMVPGPVMDAVKKEVPGGTITEAELEAKKGKIMYSFDVKTADTAYEVKITVDGKFFSKKVDDDEKDEKDEKKPPTRDDDKK